MLKNEEIKEGIIFPIGEKNEVLAEYFTGQSYREVLVKPSDEKAGVSNVTFEPGCRNHWHRHNNGYQILLVTGGEGWYQEEGKEAQRLKAGDVVEVGGGVKHWHGATEDSWFVHLAISEGTMEWLEPVSDDWYAELENKGSM